MVAPKKPRSSKGESKPSTSTPKPETSSKVEVDEHSTVQESGTEYLSPEKRRDVERWVLRSYGDSCGPGKENDESFVAPESSMPRSSATKRRKVAASGYVNTSFPKEETPRRAANKLAKARLDSTPAKKVSVGNDQLSDKTASSDVTASRTRATRSATLNPFREIENEHSREQIQSAMEKAIMGAGVQAESEVWKETMQLVLYDGDNGGATVHGAAMKMNVSTRKLTDLLNSVKEILVSEKKVVDNGKTLKRNSKGRVDESGENIKSEDNGKRKRPIEKTKNETCDAESDDESNEESTTSDEGNNELDDLEHFELKTEAVITRKNGTSPLSDTKYSRSGKPDGRVREYRKKGSGEEQPRNAQEAVSMKKRRRRRLKKPIPGHWRQYPLVVKGVIDTILRRCVDDDLHKRLFDALCEFMFGNVTIPDVTEKYSVVLTTFRRYFMILRDALCDVLGANELCPVLASHLTSSTPFADFKKFFARNSEKIREFNAAQLDSADTTPKEEKAAFANDSSSFLLNESAKTDVTDSRSPNTLASPLGNSCPNSALRLLRRNFTGTTSELREEIKVLLRDRHSGDLNALVDVIMFVVLKEMHMREAMKKANVSLKIVLAAYGICNRHIAMDDMVITDFESTTNDQELLSSKIGKCVGGNLNNTTSSSDDSENSLEMACQQLVDAFTNTSRVDVQLKAVIDYVIGVGYKRADDDRAHLISCLEAELIDGLLLEDVLQEYPTVRSKIATTYSQRCQKVYNFLSKYLPDLVEKIERNKPDKKMKSLIITDYLSDKDAELIKFFLCELQAINRGTCKELAVILTEKCAKAKFADTSSSFECCSSSIEKWLINRKIIDG